MASGWEIRMSASKGVPYFYNNHSKISVWKPPPELSESDIQQLPGAQYLQHASEGGEHTEQIKASHILVKHAGSRRPSSWKEANITRTKEEAEAILRGYQAEINGSTEKFAQIAKEHSDCSSYSRGGDLGWFGRHQMQKPFEDASFALEPGAMSDIVTTDSGVHLILRTA